MSVAITDKFTLGDSTEQFSEYVSLLFYLAKKSDYTDVQDRMDKAKKMTDAYVECRGEKPSSRQLDRLASLILREELTDRHPDKMALNEYPVMSDTQENVRHNSETTLNWSESIAQDGNDWQPKTREYARKLRLISE